MRLLCERFTPIDADRLHLYLPVLLTAGALRGLEMVV
jgi:hypothetical protein